MSCEGSIPSDLNAIAILLVSFIVAFSALIIGSVLEAYSSSFSNRSGVGKRVDLYLLDGDVDRAAAFRFVLERRLLRLFLRGFGD